MSLSCHTVRAGKLVAIILKNISLLSSVVLM